MFDLTPDPILVQIGSIPLYWYGICYAVGLVAVYLVVTAEARRKGLDASIVGDGMIVIAVAALIGGRLYHVVDRWDLYAGDLPAIVLPPYTGLGVFGGLITGTLAAIWYIRRKRQSFWSWADAVAPGLFAMQMIGRWGTSSTRSSMVRRRRCRGVSRSSASTGSRPTHVRPTRSSRRPSTRSSSMSH